MATVLIRGSAVFFSATCLDVNGAPVTPSGANLYLVYTNLAGVRTKTTVAMTVLANVVSATWDSLVAGDGAVHWSIRASGANTITQDGELVLSANEANTAP